MDESEKEIILKNLKEMQERVEKKLVDRMKDLQKDKELREQTEDDIAKQFNLNRRQRRRMRHGKPKL